MSRSAVQDGWNRTRRNLEPGVTIACPDAAWAKGGLAGSTTYGGAPAGVVGRNVKVIESVQAPAVTCTSVSRNVPCSVAGASLRPLVPWKEHGVVVTVVGTVGDGAITGTVVGGGERLEVVALAVVARADVVELVETDDRLDVTGPVPAGRALPHATTPSALETTSTIRLRASGRT